MIMKKIFTVIALFLSLINIQLTQGQSLSPKTIASAGGVFSGGGNSLSWTLGETFQTSLTGGGITLTQGFQQPYQTVSVLNLKAFLEGYYLGGGILQSAIDPYTVNTACDTVVLGLAANVSPYSIVAYDTAIMNTSGNAVFNFQGIVSGASYYLVLRHRNALETWSALPVMINSNTSYDFTTASSQAFGNNMVQTFDLTGWALFSGDISDSGLGVGFQDGVIESQDYGDMENAVSQILTGYFCQDITGDGVVESGDYSLMENNVSGIVFSVRP
jgi:hypothetical protein